MNASDARKPADLVRFHTRHKLLLMAHSPAALRRLGRLVAASGAARPDAFGRLVHEYGALFRRTLAQPATRGGHVNALQHMAGYLRGEASPGDCRAVAGAIEEFGCGRAPLARPLALVRLLATSHAVPYLVDQVYLDTAGVADGSP
jgi:uncharacterized protein YbgA (DUF1722 family)